MPLTCHPERRVLPAAGALRSSPGRFLHSLRSVEMTVKGLDLTLFSVFPVRGGHGNIPSSYTFAAFMCQVDILPDHQAQFSRFIAPGGHESIPTAHGGA